MCGPVSAFLFGAEFESIEGYEVKASADKRPKSLSVLASASVKILRYNSVMSEPDRRYTDLEIREILRRAMSADARSDVGLTHAELLQIGGEVGVDAGDIERAVRELDEEFVSRRHESEAEELVAVARSGLRSRFVRHLSTYLIVNGGLFLLSLWVSGIWFLPWVIIVWGIALSLHARSALFPSTDTLERRAEREGRKLERKRRRQRRLESNARAVSAPTRSDHVGKELEAAMQAGVDALLLATARKIREAETKLRARGESPPPRVRVEDARVDDERTRGDERRKRDL